MNKTSESLLEFKNYSMGFKDEGVTYNLLDTVSFSVRRGAVLGVVGESGCGKSMTSLSVMRLLPPEAVVQGGEIVFDGANLLGKGEAEMEKLRGREIGRASCRERV